MEVSSLLTEFRPFFNPSAIVIIGASRNEYTFNGIIIKNLLEAQYKGKIYIIHPFTPSLMGLPCYEDLDDIKDLSPKPELAILLTQNKLLPNLEKIGQMQISHVMLETDVSLNYESERLTALIDRFKEIIKQYNLRVVGPSMIGIINFHQSFTTSVIPTRAHIINRFRKNPKYTNKPGVSFFAQSGGLTGACGWWQPTQDLNFAKIIHIGKIVDVTEGNMLEYLFLDEATSIIILYLRNLKPHIIETIQKYARKKPVIMKYGGKETDKLNMLHEAGVIEVENYVEIFEFAKVFSWCPPPIHNAVGIVGPSSGAINLLISEMRKQEIHLAELNTQTRDFILSKIGGSTCELGNPVDYWPPTEFIGTQVCKIYHNASKKLLEDEHVGGLFLALEFFTEIEFDFNIFEYIKEQYPNKPIITILIQAEKEGTERVLKIANELQLPVFVDEVERAIKAFRALLNYYSVK